MNCPECGEYLHSHRRCACGWTAPAEAVRYVGPKQPEHTGEWERTKRAACDTVKRLSTNGSRDWAYKILALHQSGAKVNLIALRNAEQAVRSDPNGRTA